MKLRIITQSPIVLVLFVCEFLAGRTDSIVPLNNSIAKTPVWIITLKDSTIHSLLSFDSLVGSTVYVTIGDSSTAICTDSIRQIEMEHVRILWPVMGVGALVGMLIEIGTYKDPPPDENGVVDNFGPVIFQSRMTDIIVKGLLGGLIGLLFGSVIDSREEYVEKVDYPGRVVDAKPYIRKIFLKKQ